MKELFHNGRKVGVNYLSGFTGAMQFECFLALDKDGGGLDEYLPGAEVSLYDHIPLNTPEEKTFDKSMTWSVGGQITANKDGVSGMISGGVSYTSRETWKEKSYEIIDHAYDDNRDAETKWKLNFKGVTDGSGHLYHEGGTYNAFQGINPVKGATDTTEFKSEWIWIVDKSVWSKRKEGVVFRYNFHNQEGFAYGKGNKSALVEWDTTEAWPWSDYAGRAYLDMPAHHYLANVVFDNLPATGDGRKNNRIQFLSDGDWEITDIPSWVKFDKDSKTSGTETGDTLQYLWFEVDPNDGEARQAQMTFTMRTGQRVESTKIYVRQASK